MIIKRMKEKNDNIIEENNDKDIKKENKKYINNAFSIKDEKKSIKPIKSTLLSASIEGKVKDLLNQMEENKNKSLTSGPIVIESQFKKTPTIYNDEEKKQRADRLKNRLDRAKMRRQMERENKSKINLDNNIKKKVEEMENKLSFEKPK